LLYSWAHADVYTREGFGAALAAVVARAAFLPSAGCFAVVPLLSHARRTGDERGAVLDYDPSREAVTLTAARPYRCKLQLLLGPADASIKGTEFVFSHRHTHIHTFSEVQHCVQAVAGPSALLCTLSSLLMFKMVGKTCRSVRYESMRFPYVNAADLVP